MLQKCYDDDIWKKNYALSMPSLLEFLFPRLVRAKHIPKTAFHVTHLLFFPCSKDDIINTMYCTLVLHTNEFPYNRTVSMQAVLLTGSRSPILMYNKVLYPYMTCYSVYNTNVYRQKPLLKQATQRSQC